MTAPAGTRRVVEPMTHDDRGAIHVTYYVPCACVRERLAAKPA